MALHYIETLARNMKGKLKELQKEERKAIRKIYGPKNQKKNMD